jgi:hypothetical protein
MTDYVVISHDPFGRSELVRRLVPCSITGCQWCGRRREHRREARGPRSHVYKMFQYGSVSDDGGRVEWLDALPISWLYVDERCCQSYFDTEYAKNRIGPAQVAATPDKRVEILLSDGTVLFDSSHS